MRTLYRQFYKEKQRGFTDEEFRSVCEGIAGCPLPEILDVYSSTVKDIDYPKYLAYAGLTIDVAYKDLPGAFLGTTTQERGGDVVITGIEWDSPAWRIGLSAQDVILAIDGVKATSQQLVEALKSKKAGEKVKILVSHRDLTREIEVVLGMKKERTFQMTPIANPSPLQAAILSDWLKE